ncbi:MAG: hypothetical protein WCW13_05905 [archaeon]|jgi:hypothetical protein
MDENHKKQMAVMQLFLVGITLFLIIVLFQATIMSINQGFVEQKNQQLSNYKVSFNEVPKLLKIKILFKEGTNTIALPGDTQNNKLSTVFVNAPKGTKITFSAKPGTQADVYEKISDETVTASINQKNFKVIHFSSISFAGEHWTKNGVPISDEELNKILIPKEAQIKVETPKQFNINVEKEIQTINVELAQVVSSIGENNIESINIVSDKFDEKQNFVGSKVTSIGVEDLSKTIEEVVQESITTIDPNSTTQVIDQNTLDIIKEANTEQQAIKETDKNKTKEVKEKKDVPIISTEDKNKSTKTIKDTNKPDRITDLNRINEDKEMIRETTKIDEDSIDANEDNNYSGSTTLVNPTTSSTTPTNQSNSQTTTNTLPTTTPPIGTITNTITSSNPNTASTVSSSTQTIIPQTTTTTSTNPTTSAITTTVPQVTPTSTITSPTITNSSTTYTTYPYTTTSSTANSTNTTPSTTTTTSTIGTYPTQTTSTISTTNTTITGPNTTRTPNRTTDRNYTSSMS